MKELEEKLKLLQWRKAETDSRLKDLLTETRAMQEEDAVAMTLGSPDGSVSKEAWMHDVITDELEKPLEVDEVCQRPPLCCPVSRARCVLAFASVCVSSHPDLVFVQRYLREFQETDRKTRLAWLEEARKQEKLLKAVRKQLAARKRPETDGEEVARNEEKLKELQARIRAGKAALKTSVSKPMELLHSFTHPKP